MDQRPGDDATHDNDAYDDRVGAACTARNDAWATIGEPDPYVLGHLINPAFMGGPAWPALRQAFVKVTLPHGGALVASDGLSDPFEDDEPNTGHGAEVYMVGDLADVPVDELRVRPEFQLVYEIAQNVASKGWSLGQMLDQYGALSMEFAEGPDDLRLGDGPLGVLIGVGNPQLPDEIELPAGPVRLVGITVLHPEELAAIVEHGAAKRREIVDRLSALAPTALADRGRGSVLDG